MAGIYPDAPSRRLAYDDDGTEGLVVDYSIQNDTGYVVAPVPPKAALSLMTATNLQNLNNEDNTVAFIHSIGALYVGGIYAYLIFPDDRDIDGYYLSLRGTTFLHEQWLFTSADTTTGMDGTWATIGVIDYATGDVDPDYRSSVKTASTAGVRGVYFGVIKNTANISTGSEKITGLHLYGTPSAAGNSHRFLFLDTANADAEYTKPIDDGDVGRGSDSAFTIKVKNNSATQQANTVQITTTNLVGASEDWYMLSDDDVTYQQTEQLGNITALGTQLVYVKKAVPDADLLGVQSARFKISKASWT